MTAAPTIAAPTAATLAAYRIRRETYYRRLDLQQPWLRWWHLDLFIRGGRP